MGVFAYLRVSTMRQYDEGNSIEVQEQQIADYAVRHSLVINRYFRDRGVSGSVPLMNRDKGQELLSSLQSGDVVIASKLDRMFRSARDALNVLEEFKNKGVALHFIDLGGDVTNGIGKLVFTILSAVAEQERGRIRERIAEAKQVMRQEGKYQGGKVPFGYKVNSEGHLEEEPIQQRCIEIIKKQDAEGKSLREISEFLKAELKVKISYQGVRRIVLGLRKTDEKSR
ncbi:MAG: recombinase family protein [Oligoflexia bacterium]|nr:recombinase family protein [Oligoflexia bacterium]